MNDSGPNPTDRLNTLLHHVRARAAGWWNVVADRLELVAFSAAEDLPGEVARGFAEATRSVPISAANLGIVRAARSGQTAVSRTEALPPDSGSGLWLRRFGADRSVAVPIFDGSGTVVMVVSLALSGREDDASVEAEILKIVN